MGFLLKAGDFTIQTENTPLKKIILYHEWIAIFICREKSFLTYQMLIPTLIWELVLVTPTFDDPHVCQRNKTSNMDKNM